MTYRFIGSTASIEGVASLEYFGQKVEIEDEQTALRAICLPEVAFAAIGFTEQELEDFKNPGSHPDAPAEFQQKKREAHIALHRLRTGGKVNGNSE
jgi:hypothetical protein